MRATARKQRDSRTAKRSLLAAATEVVRSSGKPLDETVRANAETQFGFNFANVRVHHDAEASRSAEAANARAYTIGSHIAFGSDEYRPETERGKRLLAHELVHVAQQPSGGHSTTVPLDISRPHDPAEREAHTLGERPSFAAPTRIANSLGPVMARYPKSVEEPSNRMREAALHGQDPLNPQPAPLDPFQKLLKETKPDPQPTRPGDWAQIERAIPHIGAAHLFEESAVQSRLQAAADAAEAREKAKPGGKVSHSATALMDYWKDRFISSVNYILYIRGDGKRDPRLDKLHAAEEKLIKANPPDLVAQVEALRSKANADWLAETEHVAEQFATIAENEGKFVTVHQNAKAVQVFGLPESMEGSVKAEDHADVIEKGSAPVSRSVVTFMKALQKQTKTKVVAENYSGHELANPWLGGDPKDVGKYSFDIHPDIKIIRDGSAASDAQGFYDRTAVIAFFMAVDQAATDTGMEWIAFYNDFEVAKTVNEKTGKVRIGFSGGGGVAPFGKGSFHHGPEPFILHIHFNIMPIDLKQKFDTQQAAKDVWKRKILPFLQHINPL